MELINQTVYKEMKELGFLKEEEIKVNAINEDGSVKRDRWGNTIVVTITKKNYRIANAQKKSKAKTYYVEEPTYKEYLKIKNKP